jgi:hypothetical protein
MPTGDYRADESGVKFSLHFPTGIWNNTLWNMDRDSEEGMKDVEEIMLFVGKMTKQTEEDLMFQRRSEPDDEWMKFLEGKLQAFKLVQGFLADLQSRRVKLH